MYYGKKYAHNLQLKKKTNKYFFVVHIKKRECTYFFMMMVKIFMNFIYLV